MSIVPVRSVTKDKTRPGGNDGNVFTRLGAYSKVPARQLITDIRHLHGRGSLPGTWAGTEERLISLARLSPRLAWHTQSITLNLVFHQCFPAFLDTFASGRVKSPGGHRANYQKLLVSVDTISRSVSMMTTIWLSEILTPLLEHKLSMMARKHSVDEGSSGALVGLAW